MAGGKQGWLDVLRRRLARALALTAAACAAALVLSQPAGAAFPGGNGVIAFATDLSGNFEIWTIRPDGGGEQRLTHCPTEDQSLGCFDPAWSPDGKRLAATRAQQLGGQLPWSIVVMNADGSDLHPIRTEIDAGLYQPVWSPDGTRIAFVRHETQPEIWTMNSDGSDPTPLTSAAAGASTQPTWSPDGSTIAYQRQGDIYRMDADGSDQRPIAEHPAGDFHPDWSPDGSKIVFGSNRTVGGGFSSVWSMNADGSDPVELASNPNRIDYTPTWSPDGRQIAFMSNRSGEEELWAMNADGSAPHRLTFNADSFDAQADWQPIAAAAPLPPPPPSPPARPVEPPPAARAKVSLTRTVWIRRGSRRVGVPISCDTTGARCTGTLTLRAARRALRRGRRGTVVVGRARFSLRPGQVARLRVTLSRRALRVLGRRGRLAVRALTGEHSSTVMLCMPRRR